MKIVELYIYGYGKFEDTRFTNLHQYQAFFGENEAGKSTIMSFIHSILFGFPTRLQSELRYEPKKGTKYGGQITAIFPSVGKVTIERVKGKALGDVVVILENGEIGGEELLKKLLSGIDKTLFQSIFSFNLQGLQNVHGMKEEDIGRYLFSTSTIGSDRLIKVENELMKELESRFKPSGRNPSLNIKLKEIQQLRKDLRKAEENNEQYVRLLQTKEEKEKQLSEAKKSIRRVNEQHAYYAEWKKVSHLFQQEIRLNKELMDYQDIIFPDKGIEQLEYFLQQQTEIKRKMAQYQQRIDLLEKELKDLEPNMLLIERENEINSALENLPLIEKGKQENTRLQVKLNKLKEDIKRLQQQIHLSLTKEEIESINTSIFMKEKTAALQAKQKRLQEKKRDLDEVFQEEKRRLEEYEWKENELRKELMSDKELQDVKERVSNRETKDAQKKDIVDKLSLLQMTIQQAEAKRKSEQQRYLLFSLLFVALLVWGLSSQMMELAIAGGIGIIVTVVFLVKLFKVNDLEQMQKEQNKLLEKRELLENKLDLPKDEKDYWVQKFKKDSQLREKLYQLSVRIDQQQNSYDEVIDKFELWEKENLQLKMELLETGKQLHIPDAISLKYLFDAFQIIHELKIHFQEREYIEEQLHANDLLANEVETQIHHWAIQFLEEGNIPLQEAALLLKRKLREELGKQVRHKEKKEQFQLLQEDFKTMHLKWEKVIEDINILYTSAFVQTEEQFREKAITADRKKMLQDEWNRLHIQLKLTPYTETEAEELLIHFSEAILDELEKQKEELEKELSGLQDELAALKYKVQVIEDGGTYAEIYHHYKLKETSFNEAAREWGKFATAKEILQNTVQHYKQDRLPKMLQKAEEYLFYLTGGNYKRIHLKLEGSGFIIERKDRLLFDANELSQATTEQIYVAIRLALTVTIYEKYKFPLIIDDSFVNFDEERTKRVFHLLLNHTEHQVLFFTCHKHHLSYFEKATLISL